MGLGDMLLMINLCIMSYRDYDGFFFDFFNLFIRGISVFIMVV